MLKRSDYVFTEMFGRLVDISRDQTASSFFAIQGGKPASLLGTFSEYSDALEFLEASLFYLLSSLYVCTSS